MSMLVSNQEKLAFELYSYLHFYLWPFPVKWNSDYTKISIISPFWKIIPFAITISFTFLYGLLCGVVGIALELFPSQSAERVNTLILALSFFLLSGICLGWVLCWWEVDTIIATFSEFLEVFKCFRNGMAVVSFKR